MPHVANPGIYISGRDGDGELVSVYWPTEGHIHGESAGFENISHWMMRQELRHREADDRSRYIRTAFPLMPPWVGDVVVLFPRDTMRRQPRDPDADPRVSRDLHPERNPSAVAVRPLPPMITLNDRRRWPVSVLKTATGSRSDSYRYGFDRVSRSSDWANGVNENGVEQTIRDAEDHAALMATFPREYADPTEAPRIPTSMNMSVIEYEEWDEFEDLDFAPAPPDTEDPGEEQRAGDWRASRRSSWSTDDSYLDEYRETWSITDVQPPLPPPASGEVDERPLDRRVYKYKYRIDVHSATNVEGSVYWGANGNYYGGGCGRLIIPYLKQTKTVEFRARCYIIEASEQLPGAVIRFYTVLPELRNDRVTTLDTATKREVGSIDVSSLPTDKDNARLVSIKFEPMVAVDPGTGVGYTALCYRCECGAVPEREGVYYSIGFAPDPASEQQSFQYDITAGKVNFGLGNGEYEAGDIVTLESSDWSPAIDSSITTREAHDEYMATFPREEGPPNIADFHLVETDRDRVDTSDDMTIDTVPTTEMRTLNEFGARRSWNSVQESYVREQSVEWIVSDVQEPEAPGDEYRYKYRVKNTDIMTVSVLATIEARYGGGSTGLVVPDSVSEPVEFVIKLAARLTLDGASGHTGETDGMIVRFYAVRPNPRPTGDPIETLDTSEKEEIGVVEAASLLASPGQAQEFTFTFLPRLWAYGSRFGRYTIVAWRCECGENSSFSLHPPAGPLDDGERQGTFVQDADGRALPNPPAPWGALI